MDDRPHIWRTVIQWYKWVCDYTVSQKKVPAFKLSVTLSYLHRFSKFLHCLKVYEICYKTVRHWPHHLNHVATLHWKILGNFFDSLLTPRCVQLFLGNSPIDLFAVYPFKYQLFIKILSLSMNAAVMSAVMNFWCHNSPQIDCKQMRKTTVTGVIGF